MEKIAIVLLGVVLALPAAAQEHPGGPEDAERHLQMRRMELQVEEAEAELDFRRRMQELELRERGAGIERFLKCRRPECRLMCCRLCMIGAALLAAVMLVVHVLASVWVCLDIRQQKRGSGIWVIITLLTGLCGALVYAVVRLKDGGEKS
jgi:hypothetical protein